MDPGAGQAGRRSRAAELGGRAGLEVRTVPAFRVLARRTGSGDQIGLRVAGLGPMKVVRIGHGFAALSS